MNTLRVGHPNEQIYVYIDDTTFQPAAPSVTQGLVNSANWVWDTNALAWVKETQPGGGAGSSVTILPPEPIQQVIFGFSSATLGQKTMALSLPVTLASDQPAISVTGVGAGSVNVLGGSVSLIPPALVTPVQFGFSSVAVGQTTMSKSIPVTLASDQPAIPVSGNFSATPSGVQVVQFGTSSANLGQKTMSLSIPVTMASDQPAIPVSGNFSATPSGVQVVQFGTSSASLGQKTMILSIPVTLASDQPAISVTGAGGSGSVNVLGGTIQLIPPALVTPVQFGFSSATLGQKTQVISFPVTLASDVVPLFDIRAAGLSSVSISGQPISVTPPFVQNVQFGLSSVVVGQKTISLSVPVALASDQVGQRPASFSLPVTLASDQPNIGITGTVSANIQGTVNVLNLPPMPVQQVIFGFSSAVLGQFTMSKSIPMTMASDQPAIAVSGNFSATPSGIQVVQFGTSSAVMGQQTMKLSLPVAMASDQPAISVINTLNSTTGGLTPFKLISLSSTNVTNIKATGGQVYMMSVGNLNSSTRYLKFYDIATASIGLMLGTVTKLTMPIPGNTQGAGSNIAPAFGIQFSSGITIATTVSPADSASDAVAANDLVINIAYA